MPGSPAELRQSQAELTSLAAADLTTVWTQIGSFDDARVVLDGALPALINEYGSASAATAAEWYAQARDQARISGLFTPMPARLLEQGTAELVKWAVDTGFNLDNVKTLVEGGMSRRIQDWGRQTIVSSSLQDPAADGWQRVGAGACDFCAMLIGRGAVYSEATADFSAHDACHCQAVPAFGGKPRPVRPFRPSAKRSEADAQRAREWIASHPASG